MVNIHGEREIELEETGLLDFAEGRVEHPWHLCLWLALARKGGETGLFSSACGRPPTREGGETGLRVCRGGLRVSVAPRVLRLLVCLRARLPKAFLPSAGLPRDAVCACGSTAFALWTDDGGR